jgi:hypothetical protein
MTLRTRMLIVAALVAGGTLAGGRKASAFDSSEVWCIYTGIETDRCYSDCNGHPGTEC